MNSAESLKDKPRLARHLGLGALIVYGVGDILGAGIYALTGKVAGIAGQGAWISFVISAALAAVTGLTYAELSARVPRSAGAAAYCAEAFRRPWLSFLVGMLVLASGVTSTATVSLAFHGYLKTFLNVPPIFASVGLIFLIGFISFRGIRESAAANNVMTLLELSGLAIVIAAGVSFASTLSGGDLAVRLVPDAGFGPILSGAALAFYAFVGFEDLANLSEEAKNPSRDIPRAMLAAVAVSTVLYLAVIIALLWALTPEEAASSSTPLLDVVGRAGWALPAWGFSLVALFAVCNTGLANFIMASRLIYGMADGGLLPKKLALIHHDRQTPWAAILVVSALCLVLALSGGAALLAQTTSLILTAVFFLLHAGLIALRRRSPSSAGMFRAPGFVPWAGMAIGLMLASRAAAGAWFRLAVIVAMIFVLRGIIRVPWRSNAR